jgi:hypothetical protein
LNASELDAGFHLLYELKPQEARAQFAVWQAAHPDDAMGAHRKPPAICLRSATAKAS